MLVINLWNRATTEDFIDRSDWKLEKTIVADNTEKYIQDIIESIGLDNREYFLTFSVEKFGIV